MDVTGLACSAVQDVKSADWREFPYLGPSGPSEALSSASSADTGFEFYLGSSSFTTSSSSGSLDSDAERPSHAASVSSIRRSLQRSDSCSGGQAMFFQRDAHTCFTADGWRLHLTRVHDPETCSSRQYPVVMVPGLASSGEHTFDLLPDYSLANALVALGYDVWVVDLRGNGRSQKPRWFDKATWWTVDDHLQKDVPAVLQYVLEQTGQRQVHWVGHSMGGMLAVGLLSQQSSWGSALRSVTLLASGCFGAGSWHSLLRPLILSLTRYGFPAGLACQVVSKLTGTAAALWFIEALFFWPSNTPTKAAKRLMGECFRFIPVGVIQQFLGSLNTPDGLSAIDNSFKYANPDVLKDVDVPVLGLSGNWDMFCPAAGGRRTVAMFGGSSKQHVCFGPWWGTARRNYGHFDVICGKDAAHEVWPYITNFLEQHDDA